MKSFAKKKICYKFFEPKRGAVATLANPPSPVSPPMVLRDCRRCFMIDREEDERTPQRWSSWVVTTSWSLTYTYRHTLQYFNIVSHSWVQHACMRRQGTLIAEARHTCTYVVIYSGHPALYPSSMACVLNNRLASGQLCMSTSVPCLC
jgi:hypothetical protein